MTMKEILFCIGFLVMCVIAPIAYWGVHTGKVIALAIVVVGYFLVLVGSREGRRTHSKYISSGNGHLPL